MIIFKNFLNNKLYKILDEKISSIDINKLEDLFDRSYETKSTDILECIPLRIHTSNLIKYKTYFIEKIFLDTLREEIIEKLSDYHFNKIEFQFSIWENESSLDLHRDTIYKYGATLYLNDWNKSWGGIFKYKTRTNKIQEICPEKNLLIFNDVNEQHEVTLINKNATQKRKSIQIWMLD